MIFVSAQQDNKYCIWQVYVQLANFRRLGIEKDAVVLFGYEGAPSPYIARLQQQTKATIITYPDTRQYKVYAASIYFHLVSKFIRSYNLKESIFFHDADIVFRELPLFHKLLNNDTFYFSDTSNYLGAYLYDQNDMVQMATTLGANTDRVLSADSVGGAQYIFKDHNPDFWTEVEHDAVKLHYMMTGPEFTHSSRSKSIPDSWMAGMWALQWKCWKAGYHTETHRELNFTWPTYSIDTWNTNKILHNAGVMQFDAHRMFHKGAYVERSPFKDDLSHVSKDFASYHYAQNVKVAARMFDPGF